MLDEAASNGIDLAALCLADVESGEWTRAGYDKEWTFTGRVGGEDKRRVRLSIAARRALEAVVAWRERPLPMPDGVARVQAIRAAMEAASPGSTYDVESDAPAAFGYRHPKDWRRVYRVSARLTDEAVRQRNEEERHGTAIVPVDETPEDIAARLLGRDD